MKNKKYIILILSISLILILLIIFLYIKSNLFKKPEIVWTYISNKEFSKDLFKSNNSTWTLENSSNLDEKLKYNRINSMIRAICLAINDTTTLVNTNSFRLLKSELTKIKSELKEDKEKFNYVTLPWLVFNSCKKDDDTFVSRLLTLLQNDWNDILISTKEDLNWLQNFINSIKFEHKNIDENKLKVSSDYFYKIFFVDNINPLYYSYFFETSYNLWNFKKYIYNTTFLSFWEVNDLLEKTVSKFQDFVKELWFKDLKEFNTYLLKYNWYKNIDELKDDTVKKFNLLSLKIKWKYWYNLEEKLLTLDSLVIFYSSEEFKKIKTDKEIYSLYKEISELHLYFAIIGWDYANNLSEWWSWKMFFWDSLIWNWIIRLSYVYYFDLLNSKKQ